MFDNRAKSLLNQYHLASKTFSQLTGERLLATAGQSNEFYDFRPYQAGDELRHVDWKAYGRTGRLYTRIYQAERNIRVHILLDTSASMQLGGKLEQAKTLAKILSYTAKHSTGTQVHLFDGSSSPNIKKAANIYQAWDFIDKASITTAVPTKAIKNFALNNNRGLVLIISDLLDKNPLQETLVTLKRSGFDASFLQIMSQADLEPQAGHFEIVDIESQEKLLIGPREINAYKQAVQDFLSEIRQSVLHTGFRQVLFKVAETPFSLKQTISALVRKRILIRY